VPTPTTRESAVRRLGALRVDDATGRPLAALLWYGAHPNNMKADSNPASADWPRAARRVVEEALGCTVLFALSSAGDVNARWRGGVWALEEMGRVIDWGALDAIAKAEITPLASLRTATKAVPLRMIPLPRDADAERVASEVVGRWDAPTGPWLREVRRRVGRGEFQPGLSLEIHAVRIGEGALAGVPVEPFARIVSSRSSGSPTAPRQPCGQSS
jgi:hypothetical protein